MADSPERGLIGRMERIRAMREGLAQAQQQREGALRFISHDLRAPLASLITLIESIASRYRDEQAHPWFGAMRNRADCALAMADDFLRLARAESINRQNFSGLCLLAVLDEVTDEFWPDPSGTEGTGLGLLIVRTVIERYGGSIQVSSKTGEGTRFTLRLPRVTAF